MFSLGFYVDLVGMVKIMQNWSKKWKKVENHGICRNSRLDVVPSRLDHQKSRKLAATVEWVLGVVDWIEPVDRMLRPEANMSTGWCGSRSSAHSAQAMRDEQCAR